MIGRSSSFLGVAVSDQAISCAEVSVSGDRREVRATATFTFPPGTTLDSPDAAGQALAGFLRQKGFSASRVVVGVPARWLIAVEKEVPPASDEQSRATLRLQAERLAVAEHGEVVFDFAGRTSPAAPARVLLVGVLRQRLEKVARMMDAAGMSVLAITSSGLALASCIRKIADGDGGVLMLGKGGGEIVWRNAGMPRMLRHVPVVTNGHPDSVGIAPLGAELRRAAAIAQQNGGGEQIVLLDGLGLKPQDVSDLSTRMGMDVTSADSLEVLGISQRFDLEAGQSKPPAGLAPALSLALAAAKPEILPIDFKHSRLTTPPAQRISRLGLWGIVAGVAIVLGIIALWINVHQRESQLDDLNARLKGRETERVAAQTTLDRLKYGRVYFNPGRPSVLDCLRDLSNAYHEDDKIWATNVTLHENGKGTITGKAADQKTIQAVVERLRKDKHFSEVKAPDQRESDQRTHEWSYTISFDYVPE
jgi:hypothetical protein